jgi:hypothetical protein
VNCSETMTVELRALIDAATAVLPLAHRFAPVDGEHTELRDVAFERLRGWAFTRGLVSRLV